MRKRPMMRRRSRRHYYLRCDKIPNPLTINPRYGRGPAIIALLALGRYLLLCLFSTGHLIDNYVAHLMADLLAIPLLIFYFIIHGVWFDDKMD